MATFYNLSWHKDQFPCELTQHFRMCFIGFAKCTECASFKNKGY